MSGSRVPGVGCRSLRDAVDSLASRRVLLFGGKGGVGKTTVSAAAALHLADTRRVILFTTDPAGNLADLFADTRHPTPDTLKIEELDAQALYARFLEKHLANLIEVGDRGTYLDREELRRFFELSLPGVDELMAWSRIGELAEAHADATLVVDTAPTGHTLRMLGAADHFSQLAKALDAMQEKHRGMVRQFARREVRDAIDQFIEDFDAEAERRRALLTDATRTAFVPVFLAEPWVIEQTERLIAEVREDGIDVPLAIQNRATKPATLSVPVCEASRACEPLDNAEALRAWVAGERRMGPAAQGGRAAGGALSVAQFTFVAGKGGVGKTTTSASIALQLARRNPGNRYVVISVDPAHSLRDVFAHEQPPPNLAVETIDTRAKWRRFQDKLGDEIRRAVDSLTPRGMSLAYDSEAVEKLIEIAPPGADELFAINRLAELVADESIAGVVVDTAPTGHFLRLLDLPKTAGEWVRELMRILLRYRELVPAGSLGEELVNASRALKELDETLRSDRASIVVVTRPERIVVAETKRLLGEIETRGLRVGGIVANYVTPEGGDACDQSMRGHELRALEDLGGDLVVVERRDHPVVALEELAGLVPVR